MYELYYGLNARPFRMTPDLDYFCLTKVHRRALAHLRYGLQQAEGFVILSGSSGMGKTLLSQHLLHDLKQQKVEASIVSNALIEDGDLLPALLTAFNKPIFEFKLRALLSQFESCLLSKAQRGIRCAIIIDEAEKLSQQNLEILRLLSNMQFQRQAMLQVVLVGDLSLETNISFQENKLLRQRIVLSYQLSALQLNDTASYIIHRLNVSGSQDDPELKRDVFSIIHTLSGGIPSEINRICDRLLMQSMLQNKHEICAADVNYLLAQDTNYKKPTLVVNKSLDEQEENDLHTILDSVIDKMEPPQDVSSIPTELHDVISRDDDNIEDKLEKALKAESEAVPNDHGYKPDVEQVKNQSNFGVYSTLLLSYAVSLVLAVVIFYADRFIPINDAIAGADNKSTSQVQKH